MAHQSEHNDTRGEDRIQQSATSPLVINSVVAQVSPLLCLPAELRNEIFKYFLSSTIYTFTWSRDDADITRAHRCSDPQRVDLLLSSRQIYVEVIALPLSLATFQFTSYFALAQVMYIPLELRTQMEHIVVTNKKHRAKSREFLDHMRKEQVVLKEVLPAIECVELDVHRENWSGFKRGSKSGGYRESPRLMMREWIEKSGDVIMKVNRVGHHGRRH